MHAGGRERGQRILYTTRHSLLRLKKSLLETRPLERICWKVAKQCGARAVEVFPRVATPNTSSRPHCEWPSSACSLYFILLNSVNRGGEGGGKCDLCVCPRRGREVCRGEWRLGQGEERPWLLRLMARRQVRVPGQVCCSRVLGVLSCSLFPRSASAGGCYRAAFTENAICVCEGFYCQYLH